MTIRLIAKSKPGSGWVRDVAPRTMGTGELSEGDTIAGAEVLRNEVAQFGKPKGAVVGSERWIATVTTASKVLPSRALIDVQVTLPGGSLRLRGRYTFGAKVNTIPVVAGAGAFAGARGSTALSQASRQGQLQVFRLQLS